MKKGPKPMDLAGRQFGRLVAIEYAGKGRWRCLCSCGSDRGVVADSTKLRTGLTQSCGCYQRERARVGHTTHGRNRTPEHGIYWAMINRCYRPKTEMYPRYGGRGIKVCDRWRNSYSAFLEDMGERPSPMHQIDRKDNDGNYEPDNCRWATRREQFNNRSSNIRLIVDGHSRTVAEWARLTGIKAKVMYDRIDRGWSDRDVVMKPVRAMRKKADETAPAGVKDGLKDGTDVESGAHQVRFGVLKRF
jgi:hypothetical protein